MSRSDPETRWSVERLRRLIRDETEQSLVHAREAQRLTGALNRKLTAKQASQLTTGAKQ